MAIFFSYLDIKKKTGFELELSEEGLSFFSRVIASLLLSCYFPFLSGYLPELRSFSPLGIILPLL